MCVYVCVGATFVWCNPRGSAAPPGRNFLQREKCWTQDRHEHERWRYDKCVCMCVRAHLSVYTSLNENHDDVSVIKTIMTSDLNSQGSTWSLRRTQPLGSWLAETASTAARGWIRWERAREQGTKACLLRRGNTHSADPPAVRLLPSIHQASDFKAAFHIFSSLRLFFWRLLNYITTST